MNFVQPETWSNSVYFGIGAVMGIFVGLGAVGLLHAKSAVALAVVGVVTLVGGILGIMLGEDLVEVLIRWWRLP
jgi:hypothetical protein